MKPYHILLICHPHYAQVDSKTAKESARITQVPLKREWKLLLEMSGINRGKMCRRHPDICFTIAQCKAASLSIIRCSERQREAHGGAAAGEEL